MTLTVENNMPRLLTVGRGKDRLRLMPGANLVTRDRLLAAWEADAGFRSYWADAAIDIVDDSGAAFVPENAPQRARRMPAALAGRAVPLPTSELGEPEAAPVNDLTKDEAPAEIEQPEPTPVGNGHVPGNAKQAARTVKETDDVDRLLAWSESESRTTVLEAIDRRLDELNSTESDDG